LCRTDSDAELDTIRVAALEAGADAAVPSWHWGEGGKGAIELAKAVVEACNSDKRSFRYLYDLNTSIEEKIDVISREIYGANGIELSEEAQKKITLYEKQVSQMLLCSYLPGIRTSSGLHCQDPIFVLYGSKCQGRADRFQGSYPGSEDFSRSRIHSCADWRRSNNPGTQYATELL
jgi:Formate--tetrahydrofolate ligase